MRFYEAPGILASDATLKAIERAYSRQEFRRVTGSDIGRIGYPTRATESYAQDLLEAVDVESIRSRELRLVLNYAYSPASLVVPAHDRRAVGRADRAQPVRRRRAANRTVGREMELVQTARLVRAVGADLGVLFDVAAERIWLVDETGEPLDAATTLLLLVRELSAMHETGTLLVPITETRLVEEVAKGGADRVQRTKASLHSLLASVDRPRE